MDGSAKQNIEMKGDGHCFKRWPQKEERFMKIISFISAIILSVAILCSPIFASNEKTSEEYVYVIEVKGEVNYFKSHAEKTPAGMLRRMQIIPSGTVLQIVKGASISLT